MSGAIEEFVGGHPALTPAEKRAKRERDERFRRAELVRADWTAEQLAEERARLDREIAEWLNAA